MYHTILTVCAGLGDGPFVRRCQLPLIEKAQLGILDVREAKTAICRRVGGGKVYRIILVESRGSAGWCHLPSLGCIDRDVNFCKAHEREDCYDWCTPYHFSPVLCANLQLGFIGNNSGLCSIFLGNFDMKAGFASPPVKP